MNVLLILAIIILIIILWQAYVVGSTNKTEKRNFKLLEKKGGFEIRYYPEVIMATLPIKGNSYKRVASAGFKRLANYIFGGNKTQKNISMTSPVEIRMGKAVSEMSFTMPSCFSMDSLPQPNDASIKIHNAPAEYVAVLCFGGYASTHKIYHYINELKKLVDERGLRHTNNFKFLGYNPPYQFIARHNEIAMIIQYEELK